MQKPRNCRCCTKMNSRTGLKEHSRRFHSQYSNERRTSDYQRTEVKESRERPDNAEKQIPIKTISRGANIKEQVSKRSEGASLGSKAAY